VVKRWGWGRGKEEGGATVATEIFVLKLESAACHLQTRAGSLCWKGSTVKQQEQIKAEDC
jgi:hypothetical protein